MHTVRSPCNGVCRLDAKSALCLGCKRSLDEIADWPMLSDAEKRALLAALRMR